MLLTDASSPGSPSTTGFQLLPKSVVRKMYGAKSPSRCSSNVTYAVPREAAEAWIFPTKAPSRTPLMFLLSSVQMRPPSTESCTLPSSVPTQRTFASIGDSAKFEIWLTPSPSLRERRMSLFLIPIIISVSRLIERVRSFVRDQFDPKSCEMNRRFAPRYTVPDVCCDAATGASHA